MNTDEFDGSNKLTEAITGCAINVSNALGSGFLEKVYENALCVELHARGLSFEQQKPLDVIYRGVIVGEYKADIFVENSIVVELKVAKAIDEIHKAQMINYLKTTGMRVGLILNFGTPRLGLKRMVL